MPKVAIITRTKDRPVFLKRAIQSVANQTYRDYTHVIVNDGGDKDEVQSVIDGFGEDITKRIQLFHREKSSGAPDTIFNESIDRVKSDYVAIHDDDDSWHREFLEKCTSMLDHGAQGVVVRTDNVYESFDGTAIVEKKRTPYMPNLRAVSLYSQCLDNQLTALAFVYRREAYEAVGKYDDSLPVVGDWEFGIRFLMNYDVDYIDPGYALAYYHRRIDADNSFAAHDHRTYLTKVLNKYLRADIESGGLGVGYIMNSLWYERDMRAQRLKRFIPRSVVHKVKKIVK